MFRNYLVVAWRNLVRQKAYSFINIFGLAIGMACCILILLFVQNELTYDQFHARANQIYRVVIEKSDGTKTVSTPAPLPPALRADFPEVIHTVRLLNPNNPVPLVRHDDKRFYEDGFFFADATIFNVFSFPLIRGDVHSALQAPFSVVLTAETARKYFGDTDPLGKTLTFKDGLDFTVTGVLRDLPPNTDFRFDFLASFATLENWLGKDFLTNWHNPMCLTYVLLSEGYPGVELEEQLAGWTERRFGESKAAFGKIYMQPLTRMHLYSRKDYGLGWGGDIGQVYSFSSVVILILLIACFNYMNLTIVYSTRRAKEVGMRKVIGAYRHQLIHQFLGESICLVCLALLLAIALVELCLPEFNAWTGKYLTVDYTDTKVWFGLVGLILFVAVVAGSYPAFFLSAFQPTALLKKTLRTGEVGVWFRKVLVVVQFAISIALIIATTVTYYQIDYVKTKNLGFDKEQIVIIPIREEHLRQNSLQLKHELLNYPEIARVTAASLLPGGPVGQMTFRAEHAPVGPAPLSMQVLWVDHDFLETLNIEQVAGRNFSRDYSTDTDQAFILNESAVRRLGWESPATAIGTPFERIYGSEPGERVAGRVIGVVKDFHIKSLRSSIEPLVIHLWPWLDYMIVKVRAGDLSSTLSFLEHKWQEFDPNHPFEYSFLEDHWAGMYRTDEKVGQITGIFSLLALFVACLGLFGLASFVAYRRTKEIGIRKVLGASVPSIVALLSKEFTYLVLAANLIAWPIAWYAMHRWLQSFAYRIELGLGVFVLGGMLALGIAWLTVGYQAIRAARANPVEALRYE